MKPLVSVICLCYNHEEFVKEALSSVFAQTYKHIEVLIVDDRSTDNSKKIIKEVIDGRSDVQFIENEQNIGNCKSFNKALALSRGKYLIDFATDDVMYPDRIRKQVEAFENLDETFAVVFTNVMNIDQKGAERGLHYKNAQQVPSGDVYLKILEKYFISPPSMMIRKKTLEELGGYDESLEYEDFDFWVRSSRVYKYYYLDEILTKRRHSPRSHSSKFYLKGFDKMAYTTFRVIQKALWLNENEKENQALIKRIRYEMRQAFYMERKDMVKCYSKLLLQMKGEDLLSSLVHFLAKTEVPVFYFYKIYLKIKIV